MGVLTRLVDWLDGIGLGWPHVSLAEYRRRLRRREAAWLVLLAAAGWAILIFLGTRG